MSDFVFASRNTTVAYAYLWGSVVGRNRYWQIHVTTHLCLVFSEDLTPLPHACSVASPAVLFSFFFLFLLVRLFFNFLLHIIFNPLSLAVHLCLWAMIGAGAPAQIWAGQP